MTRLSLTLGPIHLLLESVNGAGDPLRCVGQPVQGQQEQLVPLVPVEGHEPPVGVGVSSSLEGLHGAADQFADVFFKGHVQTVGRDCRRDHWVGLKCPDTRCEWGWGTSWFDAVPSEARA